MLDINKEVFYNKYKEEFGILKQGQIEGLDFILDAVSKDELITNYKQFCYILATIKHETADTYKPIEEYGKGKGRPYGALDKVTGKGYWGRGYVQVTWKDNYKKFSDILNIDLVNKPELACNPEYAYKIASIGMVKGLFTGKKLSSYITGDVCNYKEARRIINGTDCADKIAGYAVKFQKILS
jgi:hypothetical protein